MILNAIGYLMYFSLQDQDSFVDLRGISLMNDFLHAQNGMIIPANCLHPGEVSAYMSTLAV